MRSAVVNWICKEEQRQRIYAIVRDFSFLQQAEFRWFLYILEFFSEITEFSIFSWNHRKYLFCTVNSKSSLRLSYFQTLYRFKTILKMRFFLFLLSTPWVLTQKIDHTSQQQKSKSTKSIIQRISKWTVDISSVNLVKKQHFLIAHECC